MPISLDGKSWMLHDVQTKEQCDTAEEYLVEQIAKIDNQLEDTIIIRTPEWTRKANYAKRVKVQALDVVRRRQARFSNPNQQVSV